MEFQSLDLNTSECDGPRALTRSHPVPACIDSCKPRHPLPGGNSRRFVPSLVLGTNLPIPSTSSTGASWCWMPDETDIAGVFIDPPYSRSHTASSWPCSENAGPCPVLSRPQFLRMGRLRARLIYPHSFV